MRERPGSGSERHAVDRRAGEAVEYDQRAPPHRDLLSEDPEQSRQQLEGEGAGEARDVPIEPLAVAHALRDVDDETLLEEVRLQRDHETADGGAQQRPGQRHHLGRASGIEGIHSPHSSVRTISESPLPPSQERPGDARGARGRGRQSISSAGGLRGGAPRSRPPLKAGRGPRSAGAFKLRSDRITSRFRWCFNNRRSGGSTFAQRRPSPS